LTGNSSGSSIGKSASAPAPIRQGSGTAEYPPLQKVPHHAAIIMDGNGRWAQARGLPRIAGHRAGTDNIKPVLEGCVEFGVKILTIYAFSTENWRRPEDEVRGLFALMGEVIRRETQSLHRNGVQVRHVGRLDGISPRLADAIRKSVDLTRGNDRIILNVAFNYGGRAEIVDAVRRIAAEGLPPSEITEEALSRRLYTADLPDPDLIIRTGGDWRLSNFLIWQAAYAEYYSTPTFWPDFGKPQLYQALLEYQQRDRRFGRVSV
jgi:undecaprenyl diphosphate synthase